MDNKELLHRQRNIEYLYHITEMKWDEISNIEFDGINYNDYPDFSDVFIVNAEYRHRKMNDLELDYLNENHDFVNELFVERYLN